VVGLGGGRAPVPPRHRHPPTSQPSLLLSREPPTSPGHPSHHKNPARPAAARSFTRPALASFLRRALLLKPQGQSGHFTGARAGTGTVYGLVPAHSQPTPPPPPVRSLCHVRFFQSNPRPAVPSAFLTSFFFPEPELFVIVAAPIRATANLPLEMFGITGLPATHAPLAYERR
jgi:hypothetical protein